MAKKPRAFFDPALEDRIREGGEKFDLSDLQHCNHTELAQLCQLLNPDGHAYKGMSQKVLEEILVGVVPDGLDNPVDKYRAKLNVFIQKHWNKIHDQMEINCTGDCYQCHDLMVLGCFVANVDHLKRSPKEG